MTQGQVEQVAEKSDQSRRNKLVVGVCVLALTGMCSAVWYAMSGSSSKTHPQIISEANASALTTDTNGKPGEDPVVATVNGKTVTQSEISGLLRSGVDKAIVVDRYINKVIAADLARKDYGNEATAAIRAADREVLATLYTTRRMEALRKQVTDAEVKAWYDKNVKDEDYKQWKLSYYLSRSVDDARKTLSSMKDGDKKALAELKPLVEKGEGFATASELPYNLGRVVVGMKKGQLSEPLPLRNGLLILKIDDIKQLEKPKLEDVKKQIIQNIALKKFNEELEQARQKAKIELG